MADSTTLHRSAAKPKRTEEEEAVEVTVEVGIWSHQGEPQYAQSVGVCLSREEGKNHFSLSPLFPVSFAVRLAVLLLVVYS